MAAEGLDEPLVVRVNGYTTRAHNGMLSVAGAQILMAPGPTNESGYRNSGNVGGNQLTYSSKNGIYRSTTRTPNGREANNDGLISSVERTQQPMLIINPVTGTEDPLSVIDSYVESLYAHELTFSFSGARLAAETMQRLKQSSPFAGDVSPSEIHANRKLITLFGVHELLPAAWDNLVDSLDKARTDEITH